MRTLQNADGAHRGFDFAERGTRVGGEETKEQRTMV